MATDSGDIHSNNNLSTTAVELKLEHENLKLFEEPPNENTIALLEKYLLDNINFNQKIALRLIKTIIEMNGVAFFNKFAEQNKTQLTNYIIAHYKDELFKNAIKTGNLDFIQFLVERKFIDIHKPLNDGTLPIILALKEKKAKVFNFFVQNGVQIELPKEELEKVIIFAIKETGEPQVFLKPLLNNVNEHLDQFNFTYLSEAVRANNYPNILFLTRNDLNKPDEVGYNAGIWMIGLLKKEDEINNMLTFLVENGYNLDNIDFYGNTLLNLASQSKIFPNAPIVVKKILDLGANVNLKDNKGNTPLLNALQQYHTEHGEKVVKLLLEKGADLFIPDKNGDLPIQIAHQMGNKQLMDIITEATFQQLESKLESMFIEAKQLREMPGTFLERSPRMDKSKAIILEAENRVKQLYSTLSKDQKNLLGQYFKKTKKKKSDTVEVPFLFVRNIVTTIEREANNKISEFIFQFPSLVAKQNEKLAAEMKYKTAQDEESKKKMDLANKVYENAYAELKKLITDINRDNVFSALVENVLVGGLSKEKYDYYQKIKNMHFYLQCVELLKNGKTVEARTLFQRNHCNPEEFISINLESKSLSVVIKLAKLCFGELWAEDLYKLCKQNSNILNQLISKDMNFSTDDLSYKSIFHVAVINNDLGMIKALFESRSLDAQKELLALNYKACPLHLAIKHQSNQVLEYLLRQGANPYVGCTLNQNLMEKATTDIQRSLLAQYQKLFSESMETNEMSANESMSSNIVLSDVDRLSAKRTGHVLGIEKVHVPTGGGGEDPGYLELNLTGAQTREGLGWVTESLKLHCDKEVAVSKELKEIKEAYEFSHEVLTFKRDRKSLVERYQAKEKLVVLPLGWFRHAVTVTLKDGWLSYTNRGVGAGGDPGTKIFRIKDGVNIEKFILNITTSINRAVRDRMMTQTESEIFFKNKLNEIVDFNNPLIKINQKSQKRGNCTVASNKSAIEGARFILSVNELAESIEKKNLEKNSNKALEEQLTENLKETLETVKAQGDELKKVARTFYKNHTEFMRDSELDAVFFEMNKTEEGSLKRQFYYELLASFISDHLESNKESIDVSDKANLDSSPKHKENAFDKKRGKQGERLCKIWEKLSPVYRENLLEAYPEFEKMRQDYINKYKEQMPILTKYQQLTQERSKEKEGIEDNLAKPIIKPE